MINADQLPVALRLLFVLLTVASILWITAEVMRRRYARGTRGRYVWASVERALRWPTLVNMLVAAALDQAAGDWAMFALDGLGVAAFLLVYQEKRRHGDDDDFWTDLPSKVKGMLSRKVVVST